MGSDQKRFISGAAGRVAPPPFLLSSFCAAMRVSRSLSLSARPLELCEALGFSQLWAETSTNYKQKFTSPSVVSVGCFVLAMRK